MAVKLTAVVSISRICCIDEEQLCSMSSVYPSLAVQQLFSAQIPLITAFHNTSLLFLL
jgi:hypothetical protein